MDALQAIAVSGYSLGGNLALKLAAGGEGRRAAAGPPRGGRRTAPSSGIGECVRALERPANFLYQVEFRQGSEVAHAAQGQVLARACSISREARPGFRTVREFDEAYTAPYFGFKDAEDYYHRASSMRVVDRVRVPALIAVTAEDDPFVPSRPLLDRKVTANPHLQVAICEHGGHCGFVGPAAGEDDGYWAERRMIEFIDRHASQQMTRKPRYSRERVSEVSADIAVS